MHGLCKAEEKMHKGDSNDKAQWCSDHPWKAWEQQRQRTLSCVVLKHRIRDYFSSMVREQLQVVQQCGAVPEEHQSHMSHHSAQTLTSGLGHCKSLLHSQIWYTVTLVGESGTETYTCYSLKRAEVTLSSFKLFIVWTIDMQQNWELIQPTQCMVSWHAFVACLCTISCLVNFD